MPSYAQYSTFPSSTGGPRTVLTEYATVMSISGNAWDMCEVPSVPSSIKPPESPVPIITNELVTQFSEPQRKFLVITNMGLNLIVKRRAIDFLCASLIEADMGNQSALQDFFTRSIAFISLMWQISLFALQLWPRSNLCDAFRSCVREYFPVLRRWPVRSISCRQ